jgi:hypothetical protein
MTDHKTDNHDDLSGLDAFFEAARDTPKAVPASLLARVLDDAQALQPAPKGLPKRETRAPGLFEGWDLSGFFGNWRAGGALAGFLVLGLFLGYTPPDALSPVTDAVTTAMTGTSPVMDSDTDGAFFSLDDLMTEG